MGAAQEVNIASLDVVRKMKGKKEHFDAAGLRGDRAPCGRRPMAPARLRANEIWRKVPMGKMPLMLTIVALAAVSGCAYPIRRQMPPPVPMTHEDVARLSRAGIGEGVIAELVEARGLSSTLSAENIIDLKQSGVSDRVLETMVKARIVRSESIAWDGPYGVYGYPYCPGCPWGYPGAYATFGHGYHYPHAQHSYGSHGGHSGGHHGGGHHGGHH